MSDVEFKPLKLSDYEMRYRNMEEAIEDGWQIDASKRPGQSILRLCNPQTKEVLQISVRLFGLFTALYNTGYERGHAEGVKEVMNLLRAKKKKAKVSWK